MRVRQETHPSFLSGSIFLLLLTGPPKFRFRDPEASLYGELDVATILNLAVWMFAGIWLMWQIREHLIGRRSPLRLTMTHKWAIVVILALASSIPVSLAPALSAFKVYQVLVLFGLGVLFVQRYGARACYNRMLSGHLLLCALIGLFFVVSPDLVVLDSETGAMRVAGRGIAESGIVAAFAILLLLATRKRVLTFTTLLVSGFLGVLLFYSLMRTAYVVVAVFFAMLLLKRYPGRRLLGPALILCVCLAVTVFAGLVPDLDAYRDPESLWTLSERIGLWSHFLERTLADAKWFGFGFVSGPRAVGMEVPPMLGSGHSIFFEAFVGGGLIALSAFLILFGLMARDAIWLFFHARDRLSFTAAALLMAVFMIGLIGGELDAGQVGFTFWFLVSLLPYLRVRASLVTPAALRASRQLGLHTSEQPI